jgi:hypothetical protein
VRASEDKARLRAVELVEHVREHGGRVYRYGEGAFAIVTDRSLVTWLTDHGAKVNVSELGYLRAADGQREWDVNLSTVPLLDEEPEALWEAAAP